MEKKKIQACNENDRIKIQNKGIVMGIRITNNIDLSCDSCKKLEQEIAKLKEENERFRDLLVEARYLNQQGKHSGVDLNHRSMKLDSDIKQALGE